MHCGGNQNPIKETSKCLFILNLRGDTKMCDVEISLRHVFKDFCIFMNAMLCYQAPCCKSLRRY